MAPIVCGIDFSPESLRGLRAAAHLAAARGVELSIVHVAHPPVDGSRIERAELIEDAKTALASAALIAESCGATVSMRLTEGVPWAVLAREAAERGASLIAVGKNGSSGEARYAMGSVAEGIVRHAPCSVLVVRGEPRRFDRILCAVDFSPCARQALDASPTLGASSITLFHVVEPWLWSYGAPDADAATDLATNAAHMLEAWKSDLAARTAARVTTCVRIGRAAPVVLTELEEDGGYDLAVVGPHGRLGIRRLALGSIAENIARHAPCSVLVARQPNTPRGTS